MKKLFLFGVLLILVSSVVLANGSPQCGGQECMTDFCCEQYEVPPGMDCKCMIFDQEPYGICEPMPKHVPEFGVVGGSLALIGAGIVLFKRKR